MAYKNAGERPPEPPLPGNLTRKFNQWFTLRQESELLSTRLKELRDELMDEIPRQPQAADADETGSYWADLDTPIEGPDGAVYSRLKKERHSRTTLKSVEDVKDILGPELAPRVIKLTEEIDQDELYHLFQEDEIDGETLDRCFVRKVDWYFKPQKD